MGKILSELIQAFVKSKGAQPKGLDLIKLKQEAARLFDESRKVIDIKTKQPVSKEGIETLVKEEPSPLMKRLESYLGFQREKGSLAKKMTAGERATKNAEARLILEDSDFNDFISKESRAALKSDRTSINDPLKILEKEFGFQAVDLLPGTGSGDDVSKLIQKLKTTKDYQGRLPNDPFFDPADAFERIKTEIDVETMTPEQLFPTMPVEKEGIEKLAGQIGKPIGEFDEMKRGFILNVTQNSPEFNAELGRRIISRELYPELNQGQRKEMLDIIDKVSKERGDFASGGRVNYAIGSGLKLLKILKKEGTTLKKQMKETMDDFFQRSGDAKYDADALTDAFFEKLDIDIDSVDLKDKLDVYDKFYKELTTKPKPSMYEQAAKRDLDEMGLSDEAIYAKYQDQITDDLLKKIVIDDNPQRRAEVMGTLDEVLTMMDKGMDKDQIMNVLKNMKRTKNASGGLNYLMGL